jgi:TRAP-type mannitol/chloroaromatic compound transport system permease small subunit
MAKLFFGQIGKSVANPMIIAIWSVALQHFWELLFESWKVVDVSSEAGEGVEKIFLTIAAVCVIMAALRLKGFAGTKTA